MTGTISGEITLYSEVKFGGTEYHITANSYRDVNINMKSYWFTGPRYSWLSYPQPDYLGAPTCFEPTQTTIKQGWGHTYTLRGNSTLSIRSIRKVGSCSETTTSSTTTESTTTQRTTTLPPAIPQIITLFNDTFCSQGLKNLGDDGSYGIENNFTSY